MIIVKNHCMNCSNIHKPSSTSIQNITPPPKKKMGDLSETVHIKLMKHVSDMILLNWKSVTLWNLLLWEGRVIPLFCFNS